MVSIYQSIIFHISYLSYIQSEYCSMHCSFLVRFTQQKNWNFLRVIPYFAGISYLPTTWRYMLIMSILFALLTGSIGLLSSFSFATWRPHFSRQVGWLVEVEWLCVNWVDSWPSHLKFTINHRATRNSHYGFPWNERYIYPASHFPLRMWPFFTINVGKYTSPMDPQWNYTMCFFSFVAYACCRMHFVFFSRNLSKRQLGWMFGRFNKGRLRLIDINTWISQLHQFPDHPCMVYLPTFPIKSTKCRWTNPRQTHLFSAFYKGPFIAPFITIVGAISNELAILDFWSIHWAVTKTFPGLLGLFAFMYRGFFSTPILWGIGK